MGWANPFGHDQSNAPVLPANIFKVKQGRLQMLSECLAGTTGKNCIPASLTPGDGPAPVYLDAKAWARGKIKPAGMAPGPWKTSWRAVTDEDKHLGVKSSSNMTPSMPDNLF